MELALGWGHEYNTIWARAAHVCRQRAHCSDTETVPHEASESPLMAHSRSQFQACTQLDGAVQPGQLRRSPLDAVKTGRRRGRTLPCSHGPMAQWLDGPMRVPVRAPVPSLPGWARCMLPLGASSLHRRPWTLRRATGHPETRLFPRLLRQRAAALPVRSSSTTATTTTAIHRRHRCHSSLSPSRCTPALVLAFLEPPNESTTQQTQLDAACQPALPCSTPSPPVRSPAPILARALQPSATAATISAPLVCARLPLGVRARSGPAAL